MELVSVEILLVALIQFARLQLSCQTNQANVPFKTSFVAASDYAVRRNGPLTSSIVGELPPQAANEAPGFEQSSAADELRLAATIRGRELSWLGKEIRSLANQQSADFGQAEQSVQRAESSKQSVLTYEVDSSPNRPQNERPRHSNEPQRGQDEALAEGGYGQAAEDLLAAPSGAETSAEPEVLRSQPTTEGSTTATRALSESPKTSAAPATTSPSTTTSSTPAPTSKTSEPEEAQTNASSATTSAGSTSTSAAPPTTAAAAAAVAPTTTAATTTVSSPTTSISLKPDAPTTSANLLNATTGESASTSSGNNAASGGNATSTAVALAPTTSTPILSADNSDSSTSAETTTARASTVSATVASSTTPTSSRSRSGGGEPRRTPESDLQQSVGGEVERLTSKSMEAFASNRSSSARSSQCKFDQQSSCSYLIKTVPVVDKWPSPTAWNSTPVRVINEFVLVPEDSALSSEDSSYPVRRPNNKELDPTSLQAEHRTTDGEGDGELPADDVELDYLSPDSETLKSVSELLVFGRTSPPTTVSPGLQYSARSAPITSTTTRATSTSVRHNEVPEVASSPQISSTSTSKPSTVAPASSTTSATNAGASSSSTTTTTTRPTTRVSQSFTIRVSPARTNTSSQRPSTAASQSASQSTSSSRSGELATSTTSVSAAPTSTRKPQQAVRLNQKILRIGAEPESQPARATTTTTSTTSTSTTTKRPTRQASVEPRQKSGRASGRHRQYYGEPLGDLRRRSPVSEIYSPLANGADEEEANILTRYTIPSQLTRISSIKKGTQADLARGAPLESISRQSAREAEPGIGRRIQLATGQQRAANQHRQKPADREPLTAAQQRQASGRSTMLDESRLAFGQSNPSRIGTIGALEETDTRQLPQQVAANRNAAPSSTTTEAALPTEWARSPATERELERAPVVRAGAQVSGKQATTARIETRAIGAEFQTGSSNLNRSASEQSFLADTRQQPGSTSRKMSGESGSPVNVTRSIGATARQPDATTTNATPTTTTTSTRANPASEPSNSTTTSRREQGSSGQQAIGRAQRKDEVMTLIASSSNVNQVERSRQSSLIEPAETSTALANQPDERRPTGVVEAETHKSTERPRKMAVSSSPPLAKQPAAPVNKLPDVRVQRGGLLSLVDEYEGSVEDQLAKDALHSRPRSPAPKRTNAYTGARQSQPAARPTMDTGKWLPSGDELAASLSASANGADELGHETQPATNLLPGRPGIDYPIHWQVPKTSFDCRNYEQSGFYADVESDCQAYHSCHKWRGGRHTFLCPNGTLFSQELLTCDWWYNVECSASKLYLANEGANGPSEKSVGESRRAPNELSRRGAA